jgi:radical SAM superfamily enzyme YgiQ (UPF0313 family)
MTVLLTTLNSKFIHSNLALRYLKEYTKDIVDISIVEFTINQNLAEIAAKIYGMKPKLVCFSTYIWNIDQTLEVCERIKLVSPQTKILLGGPEVSFDMEDLMIRNNYIDYLIFGEGEESFRELLISKEPSKIKGLVYRNGSRVIVNPPRPLISDLNIIPSPYETIGDEFRNKIVYYESSRGCPFNCAFCLSSTIRGVRYMSIDRVKRDLDNLIDAGVKQVKFVDRTFNANKEFSKEIMKHIIKRDPKGINFHLEVTAHLIDQEQLEFFESIREGLFQFEIGVQSTYPKTIEAIGRNTDFDKLSTVSKAIKKNRNIHQHLDLIAGLPYEDYQRFGESFNHIYALRPEKIQLGFLKLLKGSALRKMKVEYGYKLVDRAPYEIMESKWLNYDDVIALKGIEELVEKYYNEEFFRHSLEYLISNHFKSPFIFFEDFMHFWKEKGYYEYSHSREKLYEILYDYYKMKAFEGLQVFSDFLILDYLENNGGKPVPDFLNRVEKQSYIDYHGILKSDKIVNRFLPEYYGMPTKKVLKKVRLYSFTYDIFKIIDDGYKEYGDKKRTLLLFKYTDGTLERCKTYNITSCLEEFTDEYN